MEPEERLRSELAVADIVYNLLETYNGAID